MFLWDFLPGKALYDTTVNRCKYGTDDVNVSIKLLNVEVKETKNVHTGDLTEYIGHFSIRLPTHYDARLFLLLPTPPPLLLHSL
jgi:hypothetical protein